MAIPNLRTHTEASAALGDAPASSPENAAEPALGITIDTRRGDAIERTRDRTAREHDGLLVAILGLAFGACMYVVGSLTHDPVLRILALVPVMLSLLERLGVLRATLEVVDAIQRTQLNTRVVGLMWWGFIYLMGSIADAPLMKAYALVPVLFPFLFVDRRRKTTANHGVTEYSAAVSGAAEDAPDATALIQYKKILASILPADFLSDDGFLKTPAGAGEPIAIRHNGPTTAVSQVLSLLAHNSHDPTVPPAHYDGPLWFRVLLHRLRQSRDTMNPVEFQCLHDFAERQILAAGPRDVIDIRRGQHSGVLAHETFHDIQSFLYENHPEVIDRLQGASDAHRPEVERWYRRLVNVHYSGPNAYRLEHFFPTPKTASPYGPYFLTLMLWQLAQNGLGAGAPTLRVMSDAHQDLGRNELLPTLLSAAAEGNDEAADILARIFEEAGLNKDFYKTLPRFTVPPFADPVHVSAALAAGFGGLVTYLINVDTALRADSIATANAILSVVVAIVVYFVYLPLFWFCSLLGTKLMRVLETRLW